MGLVDFRSDKERIARSTRRTDKAVRAGNRQAAQQHANEMALHQQALAAAQYQVQLATWQTQQQVLASAPIIHCGYAQPHQDHAYNGPASVLQRCPGTVAPVEAAHTRELSQGAPAAGWYADPTGETAVRWWDGAQWTDQVRD
jgi:hypothetical protein